MILTFSPTLQNFLQFAVISSVLSNVNGDEFALINSALFFPTHFLPLTLF